MDLKVQLVAFAKKIADNILAQLDSDWYAIASGNLKGQNLSDDAVRYVVQQVNRLVKLHFLTKSAPKDRKLPGKVLDPQKVINLLNMGTEKKASEDKIIDISAYQKPTTITLAKEADLEKISVEEIASEHYRKFGVVHEILTKFAGEDYYKNHTHHKSVAITALNEIKKQASEVEEDKYALEKQLGDLKRKARDIGIKMLNEGYKESFEKIATEYGVYSNFLKDIPGGSYTWRRGDKKNNILLQRDLQVVLREVVQKEDMINRLIRLAKDYNIVSNTLREYVDFLATTNNIKKMDELLRRLEIM